MLVAAYAATITKPGFGISCVIIPVLTPHCAMLQADCFIPASRAAKLVVWSDGRGGRHRCATCQGANVGEA
jgi:hypothetical protein